MKGLVPRKVAARYGQEAVEIINAGEYVASNGQQVKIAAAVRQAVASTQAYLPDCPLPAIAGRIEATRLEVTNETTLNAARRLIAAGERPVALNFASATHPGGGLLTGAQAQEESLCWSSGLYACLNELLGGPPRLTNDSPSRWLDDLQSRQMNDGGWPISWNLPGPAAVCEWQGRWTLDAIKILVAYEVVAA